MIHKDTFSIFASATGWLLFSFTFFQEFLLFFRWFALACSSSKRAKPLAPEAARVWHRKIRKRACKNCSMKLVYPNELFKTNPASLPSVPKNQRYWDIVAGSHFNLLNYFLVIESTCQENILKQKKIRCKAVTMKETLALGWNPAIYNYRAPQTSLATVLQGLRCYCKL